MTDEQQRAVVAVAELTRRLSAPTIPAGVADALERAVQLLPPVDSRFTEQERSAFTSGHGDIDARGTHPVRGARSPVAALVRPTEDGLVVRFDVRHEGPPGAVHGSFVAGLFDVALGLVAIEHVGLGLTAELSVQFRRPVPLGQDVLYRGEVVRREGRQTSVEGAAVLDEDRAREFATASIRFVHPTVVT